MEKNLQKEKLSGLPVINFHAAGVDVGSVLMVVAYTDSQGSQWLVRTGCFTKDLKELTVLLKSEGVKDVAMEATGVYWVSLYEMLEDAGICVTLIHPGHYNKSSDPKTDAKDSQWIHQYHSCGILRNSHIASELYRELRHYIHERNVVQHQKSETLTRIQRILTLMNVKFQHLISDIEGVGGMNMIRAIASGVTDPEKLVNLIDVKRFKASREDLVSDLEGIYKEHYVNLLKMKLQEYDFFVSQMRHYETFIEETLKKITAKVEKPATVLSEPLVETKSKYVRKNQYSFDAKEYLYQLLGTDLTKVEGMDEKMLLDVVSVTGADMSKWPSEQHFTSWLNLSPRRMESGGKYLGNKKRSTTNPATQAFRISAQSVGAKSKGPLGKLFHRLVAKKGKKTATKAVARKLAVTFYTLVKNKQEYNPLISAKRMEEQEAKKIRNLMKLAKKLGYSMQKIS